MAETARPTDQISPAADDRHVLERRRLLSGAAVAGAAGLIAAGTLATPAEADDGDSVVLGGDNTSSTATSIQIGATTGSAEPTLRLANEGGPSLALDPVADDWEGQLQTGEIANTPGGPFIGVETAAGPLTAPLLTDQDVWLPFTLDEPQRLLDTRTVQGRTRITLPSPLAADGRLPARQALTFWITPVQPGFSVPAVFLNITIVQPTTTGYAVVYPGPTRPPTSTINFSAGQTLSNGAMIGTSAGTYTIRFEPGGPTQALETQVITVWANAAAWIVVDGTAAFATGAVPDVNNPEQRRTGRADSPAVRAKQAMERGR